jgi:hypothetical protein
MQEWISYYAFGPQRKGETTIRKITFVGGYIGKISLYDSGERCGPWASCFLGFFFVLFLFSNSKFLYMQWDSVIGIYYEYKYQVYSFLWKRSQNYFFSYSIYFSNELQLLFHEYDHIMSYFCNNSIFTFYASILKLLSINYMLCAISFWNFTLEIANKGLHK